MSYPLYCALCGAANLPQATVCYECGQPLKVEAPGVVISKSDTGLLSTNHLLNQRYSIISQVGKGGMGAVYKAEDTKLGRRLVAIKEMSQKGLNPQEIVQATNAFKKEAHMLAGLHHPNLPSIHDYFSENGRSYLVMSFIEGENLEYYLRSTRNGYLTIREVFDIAIQICTALDYLHTRQPPIIFRDLKPTNIMWTPGGHLYLIDFGIVRHFKPGQTKDTKALGTLGYAAPEQYGKAQTTPQADIYSLGATLHYLLSGNDPVNTPFRFAPLHLQDQPELLELEMLIMQMLDMDDKKRPDSVKTIKQELQRLAAIEGERSDSPFKHSFKQTTAPVAVMHTLQSPSPIAPLKLVSTPRELVSSTPPHLGRTLYTYRNFWSINDIAWSPDGKLIASASTNVQVWDALTGTILLTYRGHSKAVNTVAWSSSSSPTGRSLRIASGSDDKTVQVWHMENGNNIATYGGHAHFLKGGSVRALSWSPDGTLVASAGDDKTVQIWHVATGGDVYTYQGHTHWLKNNAIFAIAWSPDGQFIASGGNDKTLQVWEAVTGSSLFVYRGNTAEVQAIDWSPNSKRIATADSAGRVRIWDVANGHCIFTYTAHSGRVHSVSWSPDGKYIASASVDKTVHIWNALSGQHTYTYLQHTASVKAVKWSPDGKMLASAGEDNTVQVWQPK